MNRQLDLESGGGNGPEVTKVEDFEPIKKKRNAQSYKTLYQKERKDYRRLVDHFIIAVIAAVVLGVALMISLIIRFI
jgi:hypothetical protein